MLKRCLFQAIHALFVFAARDLCEGKLSREARIRLSNDLVYPLSVAASRSVKLQGPAQLTNIPNDVLESILLLLEVRFCLGMISLCDCVNLQRSEVRLQGLVVSSFLMYSAIIHAELNYRANQAALSRPTPVFCQLS